MNQNKLKRGQRPINWKNNCPKFYEYYKTNHPDWSDEECEDAARKFNKSRNWQCVEYYQKKYPYKSLEECEELRKIAILNKNKNHPFNIEYYRQRFPDATEDELMEMLSNHAKKNNFQNIEYYRQRFPDATEDELMEMLNSAKNDYLKKLPNNRGEKNPSHRSKTTELERKQRSPKCIEFYEYRFPGLSKEEYEKMVNNHKIYAASKLTPNKHSTKIEYWLAKGYNEKDAREKLSERQQTFTLEQCIEKYGKIKGKAVFEDRQKRWQKSLRENFLKYGDGRSPSSEFAYDIIGDICERLCINRPKKEKYLTDGEGNHYSYDFQLGKKIIEFNGDYWHMNPSMYKVDDIHKTTKKTAREIWDKDHKKQICAEKHGYKILYIWESEYNASRDEVIKKCMNFLIS